MNSTLLELASRVEQATGPDREIDCAILRERTGLEPYPVSDSNWWYFGPGISDREVPRYTRSLDAAMTLSEGLGGEVTFFKDGTAKAFIWQPYPMAVEAKAATPALALVAASLKALAEGRSDDD